MACNFEEALRLMEAALMIVPRPMGDGLVAGRGAHESVAARWIARLSPLVPGVPRTPGPWTTTSAPSSSPGNRHNPLTRTPTPFPTVCSPRPNCSVTSTTAAGGFAERLTALTEDAAARPLPAAHRYHGMLYGVIVGRMPLHVLEHASQIRQFLTAAGVKVQLMPGDRGYVGGVP